MIPITDEMLTISKSQLRHHLETFFDVAPSKLLDDCTDHVFNGEKQIQEAEAMRCQHCNEIRVGDLRVQRGQECAFCKDIPYCGVDSLSVSPDSNGVMS